jgi:hypothetical protein
VIDNRKKKKERGTDAWNALSIAYRQSGKQPVLEAHLGKAVDEGNEALKGLTCYRRGKIKTMPAQV